MHRLPFMGAFQMGAFWILPPAVQDAYTGWAGLLPAACTCCLPFCLSLGAVVSAGLTRLDYRITCGRFVTLRSSRQLRIIGRFYLQDRAWGGPTLRVTACCLYRACCYLVQPPNTADTGCWTSCHRLEPLQCRRCCNVCGATPAPRYAPFTHCPGYPHTRIPAAAVTVLRFWDYRWILDTIQILFVEEPGVHTMRRCRRLPQCLRFRCAYRHQVTDAPPRLHRIPAVYQILLRCYLPDRYHLPCRYLPFWCFCHANSTLQVELGGATRTTPQILQR